MMAAVRHWHRWFVLLLAAGVLWWFAHDFVAQHINQRIQTEHTKAEQAGLAQTWDVNQKDDLITVFDGERQGDSWQGQQVGFSLLMPKWPIDPKLHQSFQFGFEFSDAPEVTWVFEVSDVIEGRFYTSKQVFKSGQHQLDLNDLTWLDEQGQNTPWQKIPRVNTWVVRGYAQVEGRWSFTPWQLDQMKPQAVPHIQSTDCQAQANPGHWLMPCWSSNSMVQLDQNASQKDPNQSHQFTLWYSSSVWLSAVVFVLLLGLAMAGYARAWLMTSALFTVASVVLLLHPMGMYWGVALLMPVVIWQAYHYRHIWTVNQWQSKGWWLLVIAVAVVLWGLGGWQTDFIVHWPQYMLWALFQQLAMVAVYQSFKKRTQLPWQLNLPVTALLFAAFHLPNHHLMLMTGVGGLFWLFIWQRNRNIWLMAISHSLWALLLYQAVGETWLHSARVGLRFL